MYQDNELQRHGRMYPIALPLGISKVQIPVVIPATLTEVFCDSPQSLEGTVTVPQVTTVSLP
jgi:hypothetical protein